MKQLNIYDLHNTVNRKTNLRNSVYEKVLVKVHNKIKRASENEQYECTYDTPEYIIGLPLYNINNCIEFIIEKLKENGFDVEHIFPKTLKVSWYPAEIKQIQHTNDNNNENIDSLYLNYIPYKNNKGKFVLNVD
jgi:7-keto-8-aminopelargonate synthetase-like enzyme